ncbi:hypothetical protein DKK66_14540 [Aquitalea sp. USM4]|nr:hypothetical protein DKK66_14540 [Aquitalea sp. USM4]
MQTDQALPVKDFMGKEGHRLLSDGMAAPFSSVAGSDAEAAESATQCGIWLQAQAGRQGRA